MLKEYTFRIFDLGSGRFITDLVLEAWNYHDALIAARDWQKEYPHLLVEITDT